MKRLHIDDYYYLVCVFLLIYADTSVLSVCSECISEL